MTGRSINEEVKARLKEIIRELYVKLVNEVPESGKFETVSVSFDIPYREAVGILLIVAALRGGDDLRSLDIKVERKDIGASCLIPLAFGTKEYIRGYLSAPNISEYFAETCKEELELLAERYDEVYEKEFNEIWNRKNEA